MVFTKTPVQEGVGICEMGKCTVHHSTGRRTKCDVSVQSKTSANEVKMNAIGGCVDGPAYGDSLALGAF